MAGLVNWITRRRVGVFVAGLLLVGFGLGSSTPVAAAATQPAAPAGSTTAAAPAPGATPVGRKGGKLSSRLLALSRDPVKSASESAQADALSLPSSGAGSLVRHGGGRVVVQVRMSDVSAAAVERLTSHGVHVISTSPDYGTVTVDAPPGALGAIADDPDVTYASEVLAPRTGTPASASTGLGGDAERGVRTHDLRGRLAHERCRDAGRERRWTVRARQWASCRIRSTRRSARPRMRRRTSQPEIFPASATRAAVPRRSSCSPTSQGAARPTRAARWRSSCMTWHQAPISRSQPPSTVTSTSRTRSPRCVRSTMPTSSSMTSPT